MGSETKVEFCHPINLLSVNLFVCYEMKINSDEVTKEYFGEWWLGAIIPNLPCCSQEGGSSPQGFWLAIERHYSSRSMLSLLLASHQLLRCRFLDLFMHRSISG